MQTKLTQFFTQCDSSTKKQKKFHLPETLRPYDCTQESIIYKHDGVVCCKTEDGKLAIYATEYLPEGTLLVFEQAVVGSNDYIKSCLMHRNDIAKELYPRNTEDLQCKINHNAWEWEDDLYIPLHTTKTNAICPYISKFNHKCAPNAWVETLCISKFLYEEEYDAMMNFMGGIVVYAVDDIEPGEEICINYGYQIGHEEINPNFAWKCDCTLTKKFRYKTSKTSYAKVVKFLTEHIEDDSIPDLIRGYYN